VILGGHADLDVPAVRVLMRLKGHTLVAQPMPVLAAGPARGIPARGPVKLGIAMVKKLFGIFGVVRIKR